MKNSGQTRSLVLSSLGRLGSWYAIELGCHGQGSVALFCEPLGERLSDLVERRAR